MTYSTIGPLRPADERGCHPATSYASARSCSLVKGQAALLAVARAESQRGRRKYAEPETELERKLAAIWGDVLGHERIGRDDAFFELGGNSLRAAQLVARINGSLPMRVAVHQLYDHPTVGRLAKVLEASR